MAKSLSQNLLGQTCFTYIAVYTLILAPEVFGADFTAICPDSFENGVRYSVLCQVDKTTVTTSGSGKCLAVDYVWFQLQKSGSWSRLGESSYPVCNTALTGDVRCVNTSSSVATYELLFTANNATHHGTALRCWSDCIDSSPLTTNYSTCDPIKITVPPNTTPTGSITTTVAPRYDFTLICPAGGYFWEGKIETLRCEVNGTALDDVKCIRITSVVFEIVESENASTLLASSGYPTCNNSWTGDAARCASKDPVTNIYVYEYQFKADNATQHGKQLKCWSDCLPSVPNASVRLTAKTCEIIIKAADDLRWLGFLALIAFLPILLPFPYPGYLIYVLICWGISKRFRSTGFPPPGWHTHYMWGMRINYVYFIPCFVRNDERAVLIWSKSPTNTQFVWYGTETAGGTNSVSPETVAVGNGNKHSRQEKTKHTGTDGSPRKARHPEAPVELTPNRTSSPLQAVTFQGEHQASVSHHGDNQPSATPRLRPVPEPSRMTSVERHSAVETSNMLGPDKHSKLPPIGKSDNHP